MTLNDPVWQDYNLKVCDLIVNCFCYKNFCIDLFLQLTGQGLRVRLYLAFNFI